MLDRLDNRAQERVAGPSWEKIRPTLEQVHAALVAVSPEAEGRLTTIYIKYTSPETGGQPYAVLWVKKSSELLLGLALPDGYEASGLTGPPGGIKYKGLTAFATFTADAAIPADLGRWLAAAYQQTKVVPPETAPTA